MVTEVSSDPNFSSTRPRDLFRSRFVDTYGVSWDLDPDGRFLLLQPREDNADPRQLRGVFDWFEELNGRVPVN